MNPQNYPITNNTETLVRDIKLNINHVRVIEFGKIVIVPKSAFSLSELIFEMEFFF